jgi:putative acetyltransferase
LNRRAFGQEEEADLVDRLRESCAESLSLVAVSDHRVVGHILFTPARIEADDRTIEGMGLAPMAVLPKHQRRGIGSRLVKAGLSRLQDAQCPFIIVLGHTDYYPRFGFVPASRHDIRCEFDAPDEAFMILVLNQSEMEGISGVAKYRPEFAEAV